MNLKNKSEYAKMDLVQLNLENFIITNEKTLLNNEIYKIRLKLRTLAYHSTMIQKEIDRSISYKFKIKKIEELKDDETRS